MNQTNKVSDKRDDKRLTSATVTWFRKTTASEHETVIEEQVSFTVQIEAQSIEPEEPDEVKPSSGAHGSSESSLIREVGITDLCRKVAEVIKVIIEVLRNLWP